MNNVSLTGRLVRDPEVRYSQGENPTGVARYTLAVSRPFKSNNGGQDADFVLIETLWNVKANSFYAISPASIMY